ncbi:MAG: ABC transporter ATP-binding protein [Phycisphaerae bacterium]|nr:ABC transporter ATP-binding protein [Phycisphaerae bacterium]
MAISIRGISKKYRLYGSTKARLLEALHPFKKKYHREFWALQDISFNVPKGATLGIIGRNGSGKSTLLQIICSILRPTTGQVEVSGRVSALLELGAGFNPEFTGRENAIFGGRLMGLSKDEIQYRLPEIEAFADIGQFIDQPVKTYSSGMFVRLAFATAINVDPDILVVDEALAVGDANFQHKCYTKFREFQQAGKTIVFVTHDMHAVTKHCDQAFLLEGSRIVKRGRPKEVVSYYHELILTGELEAKTALDAEVVPAPTAANDVPGSVEAENSDLARFLETVPEADGCLLRKTYRKDEHRFGDRRGQIVDYLVMCPNRADPAEVPSGEWVDIYLKAQFKEAIHSPLYGVAIKTVDGVMVYASNSRFERIEIQPVAIGIQTIFKFSIRMSLAPGDYFIDLGLAEKLPSQDVPLDIREGVIHLKVQESKRFDGLVGLDAQLENVSVRQA